MNLPHRPDDECSKNLWNVGKILTVYTAQQPSRQCSHSPPCEPQCHHDVFASKDLLQAAVDIAVNHSPHYCSFVVVAANTALQNTARTAPQYAYLRCVPTCIVLTLFLYCIRPTVFFVLDFIYRLFFKSLKNLKTLRNQHVSKDWAVDQLGNNSSVYRIQQNTCPLYPPPLPFNWRRRKIYLSKRNDF
jgi:hypothetical protein